MTWQAFDQLLLLVRQVSGIRSSIHGNGTFYGNRSVMPAPTYGRSRLSLFPQAKTGFMAFHPGS